ncbi:MAG: C4-dicarboxylate ABC transporter substrate-binding protein, partial [Rhodocyclaceae bacterium]
VVAGQPAKLLVDMKPEVRQFIKLLKLDSEHPTSKAALSIYFPATVQAANYPNLLTEDIAGIAVKAFLVTYEYERRDTARNFMRFAQSLCSNFPRLQAEGHPKWREVELAQPELGKGWSYYPPVARQLRACIAKANTKPAATPVRKATCSQQEQVLGLCR